MKQCARDAVGGKSNESLSLDVAARGGRRLRRGVRRRGRERLRDLDAERDRYEKNPAGSGPDLAVVAGDPTKEGFYIIRARFAPGVMSLPHSHPGDRHVTVISGTWWAGKGAKFDPNATTPLGPGSYMLHPAGEVHLRRRQGRRGDRRDQGHGTGAVDPGGTLTTTQQGFFDDEANSARLARASGRQRPAASAACSCRAAPAALAGATLLTARAAPPDVPAWMKTPGTPMRAYGERSPHEARVQRAVERAAGHGGHRRLAHAARVARRHHHAELAALRAAPQRRAGHRSRAASGVDPRARRAAADLQHGRARALSDGVAHPVPRVLGQQRRQQQCRSAAANGRRHSRPGLVQRLGRRAARRPARGSRRQARRASGCSPKAPTPRR